MKSKTFGVAGGVIALVFVLTQACGGSDGESVPGTTDDAGADVAQGADTGGNTEVDGSGGGECTTNEDCKTKLPTTTPADCAVATCDSLQKKCHFKSKDSDGDGHPAKSCTATAGTIETGDDCDDADPNTYPGAWDGPATDFDAGAGVQSDRCDQRDNDCNGSPDDGKIKVDGGDKTCKCDPNKPLPCYEYANGTPIDPNTLDLNNAPKGICKKGTRTCVAGVPSACSGATGPEPVEQCDTLDHDCDGMSGNAGDTVPTASIWYKDSDNDNYGDVNMPAKQQCVSPAGLWKPLIPNTDCDDGDALRNPGLSEVCDGKDNNCNITVDENVKSNFCADADGDTYCTTTCVQACVAPAGYRQQNTCAGGTDCNDTAGAGLSIHPNASDLCGDGVDSNCVGGDSELYPTLGAGCTAGNFGVCKRTGVQVCTAARTSTECNATAGTAVPGGDDDASLDATIDLAQARALYDPRWDWNCDNAQEVIPQTPTVGYLGTFFRSRACSGSYVSACHFYDGDPDACNAGVFTQKFYTCEFVPGSTTTYLDPTDPRNCGKNVHTIACFFQNGSCEYIGGLNNAFSKVYCK